MGKNVPLRLWLTAASNNRCPRFESSHLQVLYYLYAVNCFEKTKRKEKQSWNPCLFPFLRLMVWKMDFLNCWWLALNPGPSESEETQWKRLLSQLSHNHCQGSWKFDLEIWYYWKYFKSVRLWLYYLIRGFVSAGFICSKVVICV